MSWEESTVLALGARGRLRGAAFALTGRTCVRSDGGAIWNEWTMRFDDGRLAFLAEARGELTVFFERALAPAERDVADQTIGGPLATGFVVVERGKGTRIGQWGDVEDAPRTYRYVDLSSRDASATLDYGDPKAPRSFVGTTYAMDALDLSPRAERPRFVAVKRAPLPKGFAPALAIGDEGVLGKTHFRVIGSLRRSLAADGKRYSWEEHLLHDPAAGFRWLALADGAWSFVESVAPGRIAAVHENAVVLDDVRYTLRSRGTARVDWAAGELPWAITVGDRVRVREYRAGARSLSCEETDDEIAWSRVSEITEQRVRLGFGKSRR